MLREVAASNFFHKWILRPAACAQDRFATRRMTFPLYEVRYIVSMDSGLGFHCLIKTFAKLMAVTYLPNPKSKIF